MVLGQGSSSIVASRKAGQHRNQERREIGVLGVVDLSAWVLVVLQARVFGTGSRPRLEGAGPERKFGTEYGADRWGRAFQGPPAARAVTSVSRLLDSGEASHAYGYGIIGKWACGHIFTFSQSSEVQGTGRPATAKTF